MKLNNASEDMWLQSLRRLKNKKIAKLQDADGMQAMSILDDTNLGYTITVIRFRGEGW